MRLQGELKYNVVQAKPSHQKKMV